MENLKKLRPVVNDERWSLFLEHLDELHEQQVRNLENADNMMHIHRSQGYIQCIKQLKTLRNRVNVK